MNPLPLSLGGVCVFNVVVSIVRTLVEILLMKMVGSTKISTMKMTLLANPFLDLPTKLKRLVANLRHI